MQVQTSTPCRKLQVSDVDICLQVLQRGLPRPKALDGLGAVRPESGLDSLPLKEAAEALLQNEIMLLLQHDAAKYPIKVGTHIACR